MEDDDDAREMYAWCMRAAGWNVEDVVDGVDALFVAAEFAPDVIVMDLRLPLVGGLEITRRLKADARTRHIPVVALSGADRLQTEADAVAAGCAAFVPKPCTPQELRAFLEKILGRG